jgi:hypothetical protein
MALNLLYRFGGKGNPRLAAKILYAPTQTTAEIVPGFRLSPWSNIDVYLALPMALGKKDGFYYTNNDDPTNKNRPFSVVMLVTLKGSVKASYYY